MELRIVIGLLKYTCLWMMLVPGLCSENLALHKPAWLSSVYTKGFSGAASNAVAGTHQQIHTSGGCSHTAFGDGSPWLIVDLLDQYYVHNVTIYNRQDCCGQNLNNFIIEVFKTNPSRCTSAQSSVCKHYPGVFGSVETLQCDEPVLGRFIRVWKPEAVVTATYDETLLICELEVYGIKQGTSRYCQPPSFIRSLNKRLDSSAKTTEVAPFIASCVSKCALSGACVGVNYNSGSGDCELLTRPEPTETVSNSSDWIYYGHDLC